MSKKATSISRTVAEAMGRNQSHSLAKAAAKSAQDALHAAVGASRAAERAKREAGSVSSSEASELKRIAKQAQTAVDDAQKLAREATQAAGEHDVASAVYAASRCVSLAKKASDLSIEAAILDAKAEDVAAQKDSQPALSAAERERRQRRENRRRMERNLQMAIDGAARCLVTYNGSIVAAFAREEDAFLFESELADLDRAHREDSARCEIIDRTTGHRLGGYMLTASKMFVFVRDDDYEKHYGRRSH